MSSLSGSVVLVTGATGQVGWGIAHAATLSGARLILPSRSADGVDSLGIEFPDATIVLGDVGTPDGLAGVADAIGSAGGLDHVAAPLGAWWQKGDTLSQNAHELSSLLEVYVGAQFALAKATAPHLRRSHGSYTMVTGAAGESMIPGAGLLVVAVRAQYALADVLAEEHRGDEFRFNEVRIHTRIERTQRPGVTDAIDAGAAFVEVMTGTSRSTRIRYPG